MQYLICDKWPIQLPDVATSTQSVRDDTPYLHFVQHKVGDIAAQTGCYVHIIREYLGQFEYGHIVEYFGGVGIDSTLLHRMLTSHRHTIMDLDETCVDVIRQVAPWAEVRQGDFYENSGVPCDLAFVDWNRFTMLRAAREERMRLAVVRAIQASGLAMVADSSVPYLHLNKGYYSELCGCYIDTVQDYFEAFSDMFREWLGFGIMAVAYHSKAAYMLLDEEWQGELVECKFVDRQKAKHLFRLV